MARILASLTLLSALALAGCAHGHRCNCGQKAPANSCGEPKCAQGECGCGSECQCAGHGKAKQ